MARHLVLATAVLLLSLAFASGADAQTETREIRGRVSLGVETITEAQWRELEGAAATGPAAFEKVLREAFAPSAPPIVEVTACNAWTSCTVASNPDGTYVLRDLGTGIYTVSARTRSEPGAVPDLVSPSFPVRVVENNAIVSLRVYPELVTSPGEGDRCRRPAGRRRSGDRFSDTHPRDIRDTYHWERHLSDRQ